MGDLFKDFKEFGKQHKITTAIVVLIILVIGYNMFMGTFTRFSEISATSNSVSGGGGYNTPQSSGMSLDLISPSASKSYVSSSSGVSNSVQTGQKIRKDADTTIESTQYNIDVMKINQLYTNLNGTYVSQNEWSETINEKDYRTSTITFKVPVDKFDTAINELKTIGIMKDISISNSDMTNQYTDIKAYVDSYTKEKATVEDLLKRADKMDDIISIESKLSDLQRQIDAYNQQLIDINRQTDYSQITVTINEKRPLSESIYHFTPLKNLVNNVTASFDSVIVFLSMIIGWVIVFIVCLLGYKLYKKLF